MQFFILHIANNSMPTYSTTETNQEKVMQQDTEHTFEMLLVSINIFLYFPILPNFLGIIFFILVILSSRMLNSFYTVK